MCRAAQEPRVAREAELRRAAERQTDEGKAAKKSVFDQPVKPKPVEVPDPLRGEAFKKMLIRLALPLAAVWIVGGFIASFTYSTTGKAFAIGLPAAVTVALLAVVIYAVRQAQRARGVASILSTVESAEDHAAIEDKPTTRKGSGGCLGATRAARIPKALETLKQTSRWASAHRRQHDATSDDPLALGEVAEARPLADGIQLRHSEAVARHAGGGHRRSTRAQRLGKKGLETLQALDPEDDVYADLRAQLYRAYAYAYAHTGDTGGMKKMLKKLMTLDPRLPPASWRKKPIRCCRRKSRSSWRRAVRCRAR
jgi:hypothetical protein